MMAPSCFDVLELLGKATVLSCDVQPAFRHLLGSFEGLVWPRFCLEMAEDGGELLLPFSFLALKKKKKTRTKFRGIPR